jgi:hypothetical protein
MQNVLLSLVMNGLMAGLLLATILYCLRLNSRIKVLQDSKSDLARIIRDFDEITEKATQNIAEIHKAASRITDNMQHKIDKANFVANDLEYMIERGNKITGKTESLEGMRSPRTTTPEAVAAMARTSAPSPSAMSETASPVEALGAAGGMRRPLRMRSRAEQELMNTLGNPKADDNSNG